jgi:iron complex outermembrane receptor protein
MLFFPVTARERRGTVPAALAQLAGGICMTLRTVLKTLVLALAWIAAINAQAAVRRDIDIPAQGLGPALTMLAKQTGIQLIYRADLVEGHTTSDLRGAMTPEEALRALLAHTKLRFEFVDPTTVTLTLETEQTSTGSVYPPPFPGAGANAENTVRLAQNAQDDSAVAASEKTESSAESADESLRRPDLGEIVVTGSHIRGVEQSASPVMRFNRDDIERTGYSTLDQFVESLPQNFGGGASQDTVGTDSAVGNNSYGNAVNLRALGPGASLVLLNGRRLAPGGNGGRFIDVSMIPLSAVESVEVLTDGASAIYGSDAVGGVVNFILRDDYQGAETGLRYGGVTEGELREVQATQSLGASWEEGDALLVYEYNHRDALDARDRDFASASDMPRTLLPDQKRHSVYATTEHAFNERWGVFADALYSKRETENVLSYLALLNEEESDSEQTYAALGTDFGIAGSWKGQLSASYAEYSFDASLLRTPVATGVGVLTESHVATDVWSFDALTDGTVFRLPGGDVRLALGGSHRRENVQPVFQEPLPDREVNAAFGELFIPIVGADNRLPGIEALELTVAGRYEKYSDFGEDVTPKYGLRWAPVSGLSVRATYGESFKAPTLTDLAPGTESLLAFIASDFGLTIPGDPLILLRAQAAQPVLHEEESKNWTAGFDWQGGAFALSVTYFKIDFEGRIDSPVSGGFEAFFTSPDIYGDFLVSDPDAAFVNARLAEATDFTDLTGGAFTPDAVDLWGDATVTNIAAETQSGIDVTLRYPFTTGWGRFDAWLMGTYLIEFEKQVAPLAPSRDVLNLLNEPIDLRVRGGLAWSRGGFAASLIVNYQDDYETAATTPEPVSSWTTVDGQLRYRFDPRSSGEILGGMEIALSAQNLFDEDPPFVESQGSPIAHSGYDSVNATPLGRFIALELTKGW